MLEGWIKSYRQLIGWQHFQEPIVLQIWIAILHLANAKDGWLNGRRIRRGEWVTSTAQIMAICGIGSNNTVIDALNTLEASGEIKRERFGNATKITVCHYSKFQGCANTAQPTAQPTAHKQEYKEGEEEKNLRKKEDEDDNRASGQSVVVGLLDFMKNVYGDFNFTPSQVQLIMSKPPVYWDYFMNEIEASKWLRSKDPALALRLHERVVNGYYRTYKDTAKQEPTPATETEEQSIRHTWDTLTPQEQEQHLKEHGGLYPWQDPKYNKSLRTKDNGKT